MKLLLPVLLAVIGLVGGLAAGHVLSPAPEPTEETDAAAEDYATVVPGADPYAPAPDTPEGGWAYANLDSQFVVPVMGQGRVASMIVMSIALEVTPDAENDVYAREPKLRDGFLRVLFQHERAGGFHDVLTDTRLLDDLRGRLLAVAQGVMGAAVNDVLVTDMLRQDL